MDKSLYYHVDNAIGLSFLVVEITCFQTILVYWKGIYPVDSAIQLFNNRGQREIRLLKERYEGVKNTCSSCKIDFVWLFLLVDELLNDVYREIVEYFSN